MAAKVLELMLVLSTIAVTSIMGQREIGLSGPQIRELQLGQNPALLEFAARTLETVMVTIDGPETVATAQEGVNLNIWCLPWLQRFPGADINWLFLRYDDDFNPPPSGNFERLNVGDTRRVIGGEFNEWLNITGTVLVTGAESPDTGLYMCEVCYFRGDPVLEECHIANISVQIIGGPPVINEADPNDGPIDTTDSSVTYRIGSDFCIPPEYRGVVNIECEITNEGPGNVSRAFPTPDRAWFQDGDILLRESVITSPEIGQFPEFFLNRMGLMPDFYVPSVLSVFGETLSFNFELQNFTALSALNMEFELTLDNLALALDVARAELNPVIPGDWTCEVNNTFGSDTATSTIRVCGSAPNLLGCPGGPDQIIFAMSGSIVPVGCTVCIPEGAVVTLDCTGQSQSGVSYMWRNDDNMLVSSEALFTTGNDDNYTCTATNIDNPSEIMTTILAYSDAASYTARITERGISQPRPDNGCSRLSNQTGLEDVDICIFVGETLDLSCVTDSAMMAPLEITGPNSAMGTGTLRLENVMSNRDNGTYTCQLSTSSGPCSQATFTMNVQVFDPARIDRTSAELPGCTYSAGRETETVFQPEGTMVTLCCPVTGIEDPSTGWFEVVVDQTGCASEVPVSDQVMGMDNRVLVDVNNGTTFVCRTSNRAGADADIVSIRTDLEVPVFEPGPLSECDIRCRDGVRTRTVVCRSNINGMILPDTDCVPNIPPPIQESCDSEFPQECLLFPVWISGEWSQCSNDCGGWRYRKVKCTVVMTGVERPDGECRGQAKPRDYDFEGCNQCCLEDQFPQYCRSLGAGYCGDDRFRRHCCWTCGGKFVHRG